MLVVPKGKPRPEAAASSSVGRERHSAPCPLCRSLERLPGFLANALGSCEAQPQDHFQDDASLLQGALGIPQPLG